MAAVAIGGSAVLLTVPATHLWTLAGGALVLLYLGAVIAGVGPRAAEIATSTQRERSAQARRTAQAWWAAQPPTSRAGERRR